MQTQGSCECDKATEKFTLRLYCVNSDVLLTTTFQIWNNGKVSNYSQIITANCQQIQKLFLLYLMASSFDHKLKLLVKLRVK
jgi:hypothetical protein